ncbi:MAG: glutathione peroxidase [Actinomycetota bacterium]
MSVLDVPLRSLDGAPLRLEGPALIVNVASYCGLTPQYEGLQALHERYAPSGVTVLGVPCNQFGAQEPGTADEIKTFCETSYGVSFPLTEKLDVNGEHRHPLYELLVTTPDEEGDAGDVQWNFEKFLVDRDGQPVARFRPATTPDDPRIAAAIESALNK